MRLAMMAAVLLLALPAMAQKEEAPRQNGQYPAGARFVLSYGPFARADTFMLDTATGRIWQLVEDKKTGERRFSEVTVTHFAAPALPDSEIRAAFKKVCGREPNESERAYVAGFRPAISRAELEAVLPDTCKASAAK